MNRFYILLFALFTLALVGCEKEEFVFDEPMIEGSDDATTDGEDDGEETEPAPEPVDPNDGETEDPPTIDPNDGQGNKKSKIIKRIAKPSPIKYPRPLAVPMD